MDDCAPTANLERLRMRAECLRRTRAFFDRLGFMEVETPLMSHDTVVDRYIEPVAVRLPGFALPGNAAAMWLQTSPEFGMKRLVAAGCRAIYQITRAFRAGEAGPLHNPEFTILEWYRVEDDYPRGMDLLAQFVAHLLDHPTCARATYAETFQRHVGISPWTDSVDDFRQIAQQRQVPLVHPEKIQDPDQWLTALWAELVEPHLGLRHPIIIYDWPASQAALARIRNGDPPVAERFELYVDGVELANGYHELADADELLARNRRVNRQREVEGKLALPENSRLLEVLRRGFPDCCGTALGFDRLVMLAAGAQSIRDVIAFPVDRA
jgi:lysyl-tRNA synthetase class 2